MPPVLCGISRIQFSPVDYDLRKVEFIDGRVGTSEVLVCQDNHRSLVDISKIKCFDGQPEAVFDIRRCKYEPGKFTVMGSKCEL
jgi:hypothetical protein